MTRSEEHPALAKQRHYDEKPERDLNANGFSLRQWRQLQLAAAAVLLIVGIAVWGWMG